jgi:hypothetical protein
VVKVTNPVYDKRSPHYREPFVFPSNENGWWRKNKQNPIVMAIVRHALTVKDPFTVENIYTGAKYHNGNLVLNTGMMSPNKAKVGAIIRYCGYFRPTESFNWDEGKSHRLWRKK